MIDIKVGDYITFREVIEPAKKVRVRAADKSNHDYVAEDAKIVRQAGSGQVLRLAKSTRAIGTRKVRTARVDAGPFLGIRAVIIDRYTKLVGEQLGFDVEPLGATAQSMYGTDVKGHA